eukprot:scaffold70253_cov23-Tisochrysis_lutea.AAC.2
MKRDDKGPRLFPKKSTCGAGSSQVQGHSGAQGTGLEEKKHTLRAYLRSRVLTGPGSPWSTRNRAGRKQAHPQSLPAELGPSESSSLLRAGDSTPVISCTPWVMACMVLARRRECSTTEALLLLVLALPVRVT